jgi:uncharacterized protein (TIGR02611 family)
MIAKTYEMARRIAVLVVGFSVLAIGIALIVLPGPAFVVVPIGLAILSVEFAWARRWLKKVRRTISGQSADSRAAHAENHRDRVSR